MFEARINLAVALPTEAKPMNRMFGLRRLQGVEGSPLYTGRDIALVVTGHGVSRMQDGVQYLQRCNTYRRASWINIGIGGHADLPLGTAMIASEVIGTRPGRSWSLPIPADLPCASGCVRTVDQLLGDYPGPCTLDMEAEGFMAAASPLAPADRILVLKIISDNRDNPASKVSAKLVRTLIEQQHDLIRQVIQSMAGAYV